MYQHFENDVILFTERHLFFPEIVKFHLAFYRALLFSPDKINISERPQQVH